MPNLFSRVEKASGYCLHHLRLLVMQTSLTRLPGTKSAMLNENGKVSLNQIYNFSYTTLAPGKFP